MGFPTSVSLTRMIKADSSRTEDVKFISGIIGQSQTQLIIINNYHENDLYPHWAFETFCVAMAWLKCDRFLQILPSF